MTRYWNVLEEMENVTSASCRFPTKNHSVVTYEQIKKGLSYFYANSLVGVDSVHTLALTIFLYNVLLVFTQSN